MLAALSVPVASWHSATLTGAGSGGGGGTGAGRRAPCGNVNDDMAQAERTARGKHRAAGRSGASREARPPRAAVAASREATRALIRSAAASGARDDCLCPLLTWQRRRLIDRLTRQPANCSARPDGLLPRRCDAAAAARQCCGLARRCSLVHGAHHGAAAAAPACVAAAQPLRHAPVRTRLLQRRREKPASAAHDLTPCALAEPPAAGTADAGQARAALLTAVARRLPSRGAPCWLATPRSALRRRGETRAPGGPRAPLRRAT